MNTDELKMKMYQDLAGTLDEIARIYRTLDKVELANLAQWFSHDLLRKYTAKVSQLNEKVSQLSDKVLHIDLSLFGLNRSVSKFRHRMSKIKQKFSDFSLNFDRRQYRAIPVSIYRAN